jgi:sodium-dependent phosphate cotransporter
MVVRPAAEALADLLGRSGVLVLIVGVALLIGSLKLLVDLLKTVMRGRAERILHRTLFRSAIAAITAGMVITAMVQSSSITTSLMVPLLGAGIVTLEQVFPFTLGANIGTTVTAMLAALSTGNAAAITVAFTHLLFNVLGTLIIYVPRPIRKIPLALARAMGRLAARRRMLAAVYILVFFYGIPLLLLFLTGALG